MRNQYSGVKFIPSSIESVTENRDYRVLEPWYQSKRVVIFLTTFLATLLIGESYTFLRSPVYRTSATLLTVARPKIDERSGAADIQHVAIQQHILTGTPLLEETVKRLEQQLPAESEEEISVNDIRNWLLVSPLPETNLVELQAEGHKPKILPLLVNTWIQVYLDARAADIKKAADETTGTLKDEFQQLQQQVESKREELNAFRKENDIVSMQREENAALSRLKGLNQSLNKTNELAIQAKARLEAIQRAIAEEKPVVPDSEKRSLATLEQRAQELREIVTKNNRQFTPSYIMLHPDLKIIPEQLRKLEQEIAGKLDYGKKYMLTDAEQEYASAQQAVISVQAQLDELKEEAAEFTAKFSKNESLGEELKGLELVFRETGERLAQVEAKQYEKYPQVDVVEWAYLPRDPIRPDYFRDAGIALVASIILGLLAVWIHEYLTRREEIGSAITLSGVHVYGDGRTEKLANSPVPTEINHQPTQALSSPFPRELSIHEVTVLLANADFRGKQLIALLLSGLSIDEVLMVRNEHIDVDSNEMTVQSPNMRRIPLLRSVKKLCLESNEFPAWQAKAQTSDSQDLAALVSCIAIDSGLSNPEQIDVNALRHTYITYLIRQGLRLSELERIVGPLPTSTLASYGRFSPAGPGLSVESIDLEYPAFHGLKSERK